MALEVMSHPPLTAMAINLRVVIGIFIAEPCFGRQSAKVRQLAKGHVSGQLSGTLAMSGLQEAAQCPAQSRRVLKGETGRASLTDTL